MRKSSLNEKERGVYLLVLKLKDIQRIQLGKLSEICFKAGIYLYIGRARRGLRARLERHMRDNKKLFWHIDYLLQKAKIEEVWIKRDVFDECGVVLEIKKILKDSSSAIRNVGSSDCRCPAHLFYIHQKGKVKTHLTSLREKISFEKIEIHGNQI